jgi:hypothetical protein
MSDKSGFFALVNESYRGPFLKLSEARTEARKYGSNIPIYHGVLSSDGNFEGQLVPKPIVEKSAPFTEKTYDAVRKSDMKIK